MKTPIWESAPGALEALLETDSFVTCDLYTYAAAGGSILCRYCTADIDITIPSPISATWLGRAPLHGPVGGQRPLAHWKVGLDVDSWQWRVSPRKRDPFTNQPYPDKLLGKPWLESIRVGNLDGSTIQVDRAYFASWPVSAAGWGKATPVGVLTIFAGPIVAADLDQGGTIITANDYRVLLQEAMPRQVYTLFCRHLLYGPGCFLSQPAFSVNGTVAGGSTPAAIHSAIAAPPGSGTYSLGKIAMTSGQNAGFIRFVRQWTGGVFTPIAPFPYPVNTGDAFTASAGCDKTKATCALFANSDNYGGEDFIPAPETAI